MADVIINAGNGLQYFPSVLSPDFAYRFARGSAIWACLLRFPSDFSLDEGPAIFRSIDSGATWVLQADAGAPISNKIGPTSVTYDARFNYLDPVARDQITFVYAENPSTPTFDWHTCDFNFTSRTYGAPYGHFTVDRPTASHNNFSSRPDGSLITVYSRVDASSVPIGCFYRIFSSGSWSSEAMLEGGMSGARNLAVDSSGNSHIITDLGNYYRIDASNAVVAGPVSATPMGSAGNLTIIGNSLCIGYSTGSTLVLATGTPLASPAWTTEIAATAAGGGGTNKIWVQQISGSYAWDIEVDIGGVAYTVDSQPFTASGLTFSWISPDSQHIVQSVRNGAIWSAPATIWTASPPASNLFSLAARGGGGPKNRSHPIFRG